MTRIKDIRVFDDADLRYDVSELDINIEKETLYIWIKPPRVCLKELIETWADHEEIEKAIKNKLQIEGVSCERVRYFPGTDVIHLNLSMTTPTIHIAELLNIPEEAITPYWRGYAIINTRLI